MASGALTSDQEIIKYLIENRDQWSSLTRISVKLGIDYRTVKNKIMRWFQEHSTLDGEIKITKIPKEELRVRLGCEIGPTLQVNCDDCGETILINPGSTVMCPACGRRTFHECLCGSRGFDVSTRPTYVTCEYCQRVYERKIRYPNIDWGHIALEEFFGLLASIGLGAFGGALIDNEDWRRGAKIGAGGGGLVKGVHTIVRVIATSQDAEKHAQPKYSLMGRLVKCCDTCTFVKLGSSITCPVCNSQYGVCPDCGDNIVLGARDHSALCNSCGRLYFACDCRSLINAENLPIKCGCGRQYCICPGCGSIVEVGKRLVWIAQYETWYCYSCHGYFSSQGKRVYPHSAASILPLVARTALNGQRLIVDEGKSRCPVCGSKVENKPLGIDVKCSQCGFVSAWTRR